jgi:hypothetical protein
LMRMREHTMVGARRSLARSVFSPVLDNHVHGDDVPMLTIPCTAHNVTPSRRATGAKTNSRGSAHADRAEQDGSRVGHSDVRGTDSRCPCTSLRGACTVVSLAGVVCTRTTCASCISEPAILMRTGGSIMIGTGRSVARGAFSPLLHRDMDDPHPFLITTHRAASVVILLQSASGATTNVPGCALVDHAHEGGH